MTSAPRIQRIPGNAVGGTACLALPVSTDVGVPLCIQERGSPCVGPHNDVAPHLPVLVTQRWAYPFCPRGWGSPRAAPCSPPPYSSCPIFAVALASHPTLCQRPLHPTPLVWSWAYPLVKTGCPLRMAEASPSWAAWPSRIGAHRPACPPSVIYTITDLHASLAKHGGCGQP